MNKKIIRNVILLFALVIILFGTGISLVNLGIISDNTPKINSNEINITLIINYGNNDTDIYNFKTENDTVYSILIEASELYNFTIGTKYFDQYQCHYVYSINSVDEGENNRFWQYYLNGDYGIVGADLQIVKNNDTIEWRYQEL